MNTLSIIITREIIKVRATCCSFLRSAITRRVKAHFSVANALGASSNTTSARPHGEAADQALHKLMHLHMQRYERQIVAVQRELAPFEQQYGLSSAECHQRFLAGEMGDSADIMEWMGLYEDVLLY